MKTYLSSLNEREKLMVIAAGVCLIIYLYYLLFYGPLQSRIHQKSEQYIEKVETLQWMKKASLSYRISMPKQTLDNSKLLSLIASQLKEKEIVQFPAQLQQTSSGEIQITFDEIPFQLFINWLSKINIKNQIVIKQFEADRTDKPGVTHLMVLLSTS